MTEPLSTPGTYRPCPGRAWPGHRACFGHLQSNERGEVLEAVHATPDGEIDVLRRSAVPRGVLEEVLAVLAPTGQCARGIDGRGAIFDDTLAIRGMEFAGPVRFSAVAAKQSVDIGDSTFLQGVTFQGAKVERSMVVKDTVVKRGLVLNEAAVGENLTLRRVRLSSMQASRATVAGSTTVSGSVLLRDSNFKKIRFGGRLAFTDCTFAGNLQLNRAESDSEFELQGCEVLATLSMTAARCSALLLRKVVVRRGASLNDMHVSGAVIVDLAAKRNVDLNGSNLGAADLKVITPHSLILNRANFSARALIRVEGARVVAVALTARDGILVEQAKGSIDLTCAQLSGASLFHGRDAPQLVGLRQASAGAIRVVAYDIGHARLSGAAELDKFQWSDERSLWRTPSVARRCVNEARVLIKRAPLGPQRLRATTARPAIADEWDLRTKRSSFGWHLPEAVRDAENSPAAEQVEELYRQLRKGREAAGDHAGASAYYYGEMEMRRLAAPAVSLERFVLGAYRVASGYGVRVGRPLLLLFAVWAALALGFTGFGLVDPGSPYAPRPAAEAKADACGAEVRVSRRCLPPATSIQYAAESLVSLPGEQPALTQSGRALRLGGRLVGPVLIALLVLAIRNRVKR